MLPRLLIVPCDVQPAQASFAARGSDSSFASLRGVWAPADLVFFLASSLRAAASRRPEERSGTPTPATSQGPRARGRPVPHRGLAANSPLYQIQKTRLNPTPVCTFIAFFFSWSVVPVTTSKQTKATTPTQVDIIRRTSSKK